MSKRYPLARYHLPVDVNPTTTVCFKVEVPNDFFHIIAFKSQIYQLASAAQWDNDDAHTALDVAAVWWKVFNNLKLCEPPLLVGGADEGNEQMIRQNPSNPCELQTSINGTDWCTFADLSKCIPAGSQPGSGTPQPPSGGGQQCYHARLQGSGKWLLPTQVNTGDVIVISEVSGAATDGTSTWFCPNGQTFFLGSCGGTTITASGDPLNTKPHMELIAKINGVYYEMYNASLTIPAGVVNANVEFQLNDGTLSDNFGEITFKSCVTNNAPSTWEYVIDFTQSSGNWFPSPGDDGNLQYAVWVAGTGWRANCVLDDGGTNYYQYPIIRFTPTRASTVTYMECLYDRGAVGASAGLLGDVLAAGGSNLFVRTSGYPTGSNLLMSWVGSQALTTSQVFAINVTQDFEHIAGHSCPLVTPNAVIRRFTARGTGLNPFT